MVPCLLQVHSIAIWKKYFRSHIFFTADALQNGHPHCVLKALYCSSLFLSQCNTIIPPFNGLIPGFLATVLHPVSDAAMFSRTCPGEISQSATFRQPFSSLFHPTGSVPGLFPSAQPLLSLPVFSVM